MKLEKPQKTTANDPSTQSVQTANVCEYCGRAGQTTATAKAEAEQGDGPAASSASCAAIGNDGRAETSAVAVVVGPTGAAAANDIGTSSVGPNGAAAAATEQAVAVGQNGAAATSNAANSSSVVIDKDGVQVTDGENTEETKID